MATMPKAIIEVECKHEHEGKDMIFNGSEKIKDDGGDYLVLTDYGCEGLSVTHQAATHEDALRWMTECNYGSPQTLVKLVRVDTRDIDTPNAGQQKPGK